MAQRAAERQLGLDAAVHGGEGAAAWAGFFMAVFLAGSFLLSLANPALLNSPSEPLHDGSWSAVYQEEFDRESPLFAPASTLWGVIEFGVFGQGRPGVLIGDDGWLFSTEEFAFPADPRQARHALESNLDLIAGVRERLNAEGVELVIALLPAKARVHSEWLGRYSLPEGPRERYRNALMGLGERRVPVADLLGALEEAKEGGDAFLRTDTHWTPHGAAAAAEAVAARVEEIAAFGWLGGTIYSRQREEVVQHRGDLTRFLPLGPFYDDLGPADDALPLVSVTAREASNDLFAGVEIPVTLVGTSYSEDDRWDFAGALRVALGSDVLLAAQQGRGPYLPLLDYLSGDAYHSARPEVLVWEIPERYLSEPWQAAQ